VYKKDDMREYRRLCRKLERLFFNPENRGKHYGCPGSSFSSQQNCIIKVRIGKELTTHNRFIKEYLPQENKEHVGIKPALFGGDGFTLENYIQGMTGKHFKFIVSPENQNIDIKALVKTLVKRVEKISGYHLYWTAAVHTDTSHPHAHILINGTDKNGKEVFFDKLFITQTMREMSRQICTEMAGKRSRAEIRASVLQSCNHNRYCPFDDALREKEIKLQKPDGPYTGSVETDNELLYRRLCHLSDLGLAKQKAGSDTVFFMEKDWSGKLRAVGRYNSFLKARSQLIAAPAPSMELYTKETGEITGTITRLYKMNDEDSWNHAILVENASLCKAWYIPLYHEPKDILLKAEIICRQETTQKGLLVPRITVKKWNTRRQDSDHVL
jgi:hypothetical protein